MEFVMIYISGLVSLGFREYSTCDILTSLEDEISERLDYIKYFIFYVFFIRVKIIFHFLWFFFKGHVFECKVEKRFMKNNLFL